MPACFPPVLISFLALGLIAVARADVPTPAMTYAPVFAAARLGYDTTRIPALVRTDRGTLLAFCEGRSGGVGDWARISIIGRRSRDGGESWDDVRVIAKSTGGPVSNATPLIERDGTVLLLYQRDYRRCFICESHDDGVSWDAPRDITAVFEQFQPEYPWQVLAPGPGHGIQLRTGRLIVPIWLSHPGGKAIPGGDHRPSCVATIYSDDGGATWHRGQIVVGTTAEHPNPSETAAVELGDGRVLLNIRSEAPAHRRLVSVSPDGAAGWSAPVFDQTLYEPVCMASLLATRDPESSRRVILFCNPDSWYKPQDLNAVHFRARENGVIRLSYDDGKTWPVSRPIEAGPFSYSDLAAGPDGTVYCLYEAGVWDPAFPIGTTSYVALAKFSIQWIEGNPTPARSE